MPTRRQVNPLVTKPESVKKVAKKAQPVKKTVAKKAASQPKQTQQSRQIPKTKLPANVGRVGNVGSVNDLRVSPQGKPWFKFTLAHTPYNPETREQGETVWYSCICFGNLAEHAVSTIETGMRVVVAGRPDINEYTDNQGENRIDRQILCDGVGPDLTFATASVKRSFNNGKVSEPKFFEDDESEEYEEEPF